jgi:hypothetical protein
LGPAIALVGEDGEVCKAEGEGNTASLYISLAKTTCEKSVFATYEAGCEAHVAGMSCLECARNAGTLRGAVQYYWSD